MTKYETNSISSTEAFLDFLSVRDSSVAVSKEQQ